MVRINLYTPLDKSYDVRIIKNKNRFKQRSLSHANALDFGMEHIKTKVYFNRGS